MDPRVLIYSNRNVVNKIFTRCMWIEFENVIKTLDCVDLIAPFRTRNTRVFDLLYNLAGSMGKRFPIAIDPGTSKVFVHRNYELFLYICSFPQDLLYLGSLKNWRKRCKSAVCLIDEFMIEDLSIYKYAQNILQNFDYVFVCCNDVIENFSTPLRDKCIFTLPGVDALLFCPSSALTHRSIDVLSYGRRDENVHRELVELAREKKIFYIFDSVSYRGAKYGLTVENEVNHRLLIASLLKNSKYSLVNPGKFNIKADLQTEEVIGARYFEVSGSGAIMVGSECKNFKFKQLFKNDDIVKLDKNTGELSKLLKENEKFHERNYSIRKRNIIKTLLYHDWVYRYDEIIKTVGVTPLPQLEERKRHLRMIAEKLQAEKYGSPMLR
jgi:hypothetical protein